MLLLPLWLFLLLLDDLEHVLELQELGLDQGLCLFLQSLALALTGIQLRGELLRLLLEGVRVVCLEGFLVEEIETVNSGDVLLLGLHLLLSINHVKVLICHHIWLGPLLALLQLACGLLLVQIELVVGRSVYLHEVIETTNAIESTQAIESLGHEVGFLTLVPDHLCAGSVHLNEPLLLLRCVQPTEQLWYWQLCF